MSKSHPQLTWKLLFAVCSVSFSTCFTFGFSLVATNATQHLIVNWIRSVQCARFGGNFGTNVTTPDSVNQSSNNISDIWCMQMDTKTDDHVEQKHPLLSVIWAVTGSSISVGAFVSVWLINHLLFQFGSKGTLLLNNVLGVIGVILTGLCVTAGSYELLIIGRFIIGVNIGINTSVGYVYITEVCPPNLRGAGCTCNALFHVFGMLIATTLGLPQLLGTVSRWLIIFWLRLVPSVVMFITIPFCPESPRHLLLVKGQTVEAKEALEWFRGTVDVADELAMIQRGGNEAREKMSHYALLKDPQFRRILAIASTLMLSQQLTGNTAIAIYSTSIFASAGLRRDESQYGSVGVMVLALFGTIAAMFLVDRVGRRLLLIMTYAGMSASCAGIVLFMWLAKHFNEFCKYGSLICVLLFTVIFNLSAPIPWIIAPEIFTHSTRGSGVTFSSAVFWGANIVVVFSFPIIRAAVDEWVFAIFAGAMLCCTVWVYRHVFETKGKDIEAIHASVRRGSIFLN